MRTLRVMLVTVFVAALASCAPALVTPEELIAQRPFEEAFAVVTNTIATQPYPENTGGWVVTESDQVGGFVTAELEGESCAFLGLGCSPFVARVSVALNARGAELTAVNISHTGEALARDLAARIADRLSAP